MKISNKIIPFTAILSMGLFFCGVNISHFDTGRLKISEIIDTGMYNWNMRSIAHAASEGKIPSEDYGVNKGVPNDQSDNSGIQEDGCITLLRIVSVVAMGILLAWYIRRKMKL